MIALKLRFSNIKKQLTDDKYRFFFEMLVVSAVLGTVSAAMCIMNIFTHKTVLMIATLVFAVICYVNCALLLHFRACRISNQLIFILSCIVLFTYFLLTGGTAGFSPHWILLLPVCGVSLLGNRTGFLVSAVMFVITAFLLWLPAGQALLMYEYSPEFCMRFPMVYIAFWAIGTAFDEVRAITHRQLLEAQAVLKTVSETDYLTQLHNRHWFYKKIYADYAGKKLPRGSAVILLDLDYFKSVNDTHGHQAGDVVLRSAADTFGKVLGEDGMICRWGGEEFLAYLPDVTEEKARSFAQALCDSAHTIDVSGKDGVRIPITISVGALFLPVHTFFDVDAVFVEVDKFMYDAKQGGRDRVAFGRYAPNPQA